MGIDYPNCSSNWSAESTANNKISIMSSSNSDAYPQTTTANCVVRNAGSSHSITTNTVTVYWHWPKENLKASGLPATPENDDPLEDVPASEITNVTDPNHPGYVLPNTGVTYVIAGVNPTVAWFYDHAETFVDLAGLLAGSDEAELAFAASGLTIPTAPKDITGTVADDGSALTHACSITKIDYNASPANSGDYRVDPPTMALSCPTDPVQLEQFQAKFIHTVKIKKYFTIYHYVGDLYTASGFSGTKPTEIREQTGNSLPVNYYWFSQY